MPCDYGTLCYHGTHVAGIAAGHNSTRHGAAPGANLIAIQIGSEITGSGCGTVPSPCVTLYDSDAIAALDYVADTLSGVWSIASVNMSFGSTSTSSSESACGSSNGSFESAVAAVRALGIAPVAASGNGSVTTGIASPGCLPSVIGVGASYDNSDAIYSKSNSGPPLDLLAPGTNIYSSVLNGAYGTEKRPVRLGIRVEKVEFHKTANRLRIFGMIEQGLDTGSHHTLNIEPGYEISVIRKWRPVDLERITRAVRTSLYDVVHILTIEEGDAELFRMRQFGPEGILSVSGGSGTESGTGSRAEFFERVASHLTGISGPLIIAGPGFVKDDFLRYLKSAAPAIAEKAVVVETRRIGPGAVQEMIGLGTLDTLGRGEVGRRWTR